MIPACLGCLGVIRSTFHDFLRILFVPNLKDIKVPKRDCIFVAKVDEEVVVVTRMANILAETTMRPPHRTIGNSKDLHTKPPCVPCMSKDQKPVPNVGTETSKMMRFWFWTFLNCTTMTWRSANSQYLFVLEITISAKWCSKITIKSMLTWKSLRDGIKGKTTKRKSGGTSD